MPEWTSVPIVEDGRPASLYNVRVSRHCPDLLGDNGGPHRTRGTSRRGCAGCRIRSVICDRSRQLSRPPGARSRWPGLSWPATPFRSMRLNWRLIRGRASRGGDGRSTPLSLCTSGCSTRKDAESVRSRRRSIESFSSFCLHEHEAPSSTSFRTSARSWTNSIGPSSMGISRRGTSRRSYARP